MLVAVNVIHEYLHARSDIRMCPFQYQNGLKDSGQVMTWQVRHQHRLAPPGRDDSTGKAIGSSKAIQVNRQSGSAHFLR